MRAWILALSLMSLMGVCVSGGAAFAEDQPTTHPCQADSEKYCSGVKVGSSRMKECLKTHRDQLSDACKESQPRMK